MPDPMRVAYTMEQCWHDVPGGTTTATLAVARRLADRADVDLVGVAGRHRSDPDPAFRPPIPVRRLPIARPWLYETWNRFDRPRVESATGRVDVCHSTTAIPAGTTAPHVVTVHDVAFVHAPERFSRHGVRVMTAGLERCRRSDLVLVPSRSTLVDLVDLGFDDGTIRVVPWGVDITEPIADDRRRVRSRYDLPDRFALFVGTIEPRKNLARLAEAVARLDDPIPLVVVGADGWGDVEIAAAGVDVRFVGFVPAADLAPIYASSTVFAYPSLQEGFGLPILEAMAQGVPVVTSRGSATEEVAGGAAVLVDPLDVDSIAGGITDALGGSTALAARGRRRAEAMTWEASADATVDAYREVAP